MAVDRPARWTAQRLIAWTAQHFGQKEVDAPRLTAELLLGQALGLSRLQLYMDLQRPLNPSELAAFRVLVQHRSAGTPLQHLLGSEAFYGRPFKVDRRALIPRPETELLVEAALATLPADPPLRLLDLGTGSGVIALSLLAERPNATAVAIDLSAEALALAGENAAALGVANRVDLRQGDLFAPLRAGERFDAVVANPPYVKRGDIAGLQREVRDHDPHLALDGGEDGLALLRRIVAEAPLWLLPGAPLWLEIGDDQGPAVLELLLAGGYTAAAISKDLAQLDRLAFGRSPAPSPQAARRD